MADPDSHTKCCSRKECCRDCAFIKRELIPEMVHDRCFCEPRSREFVEFDNADVEHLRPKRDFKSDLYRVTARVKFSGEPHNFFLIVKLLGSSESLPSGPFQNEEMFYSKMTREYGTDIIPKCYLSDLGRYGRPVVVLEDLAVHGYAQVDRKLDEDHLKLCVRALATFHGRGLKLKAREYPIFREFCTHLSAPEGSLSSDETSIDGECRDMKIPSPLFDIVERKMRELNTPNKLTTEINDVSTVCHGQFMRDNVLFRYENGKPSDVKVIDWKTMICCSPVFDFGLILFTNLPDENESSNVVAFCRDILRIYLDTVRDEYPEVDRNLLERDVITKLPYVYVPLFKDRIEVTPNEVKMIFHVCDNLKSRD